MLRFLTAFGLDTPAFSETDSPDGNPLSLAVPPGEQMRIRQLAQDCFSAGNDTVPNCRLLLAALLSLFLQAQLQPDDTASPAFARTLAEMNRLENAAEGVPAFLRLSNFSHAQLCRLTKKHLGMTPGAYINEIRLKYACELLRRSDLDYQTVGERVGFSSYSHFCSLLKKAYHMTPAQIRRTGGGGEWVDTV